MSGKIGAPMNLVPGVRKKPTKRQRALRNFWAKQKRKDAAEIAAVAARNAARQNEPSEVRIWTEADL